VVGLAQGLFDLGWRISAREDEPHITAAFRQRRQLLAGSGGDENLEHAGRRASLLEAAHVLVNSGPRNGDHHDA
jgi:hypothetical protein